jgi:NAD(P)-dependent dehydrogenase (short-subunit alcohol dehydrogenase family)
MANVAIVTGHSSGLGRAVTERLLEAGNVVVGVSRRPLNADLGSRHIHISGSVADQGTVDSAFTAAQDAGELRLVVNCAGQGVFGNVGEYSVDEVRSALEGNLLGLIAFTDRAIAVMGAGGGDIVNVMSTASKKLRPTESVYTAAKWGAKAYTRTVREAVKAAQLPIRIFEVYPCGMNTRFWNDAVRPLTDGKAFPEPGPIADAMLQAVNLRTDSYQQELTFERS